MKEATNYLRSDTICALATAAGGPVAIIRVSGSKALEILRALRNEGGTWHPEPRKIESAALVRSSHGGGRTELLDRALSVYFRAPFSFTGEDVVELHCHGGVTTPFRLLAEVKALGARSAYPGEFSFRAVRNGKMTVPEAEAVSELIQAKGEAAASLALEKLSGLQSRWLTEIAEELRLLLTLSEVGIDFSDQEVEELSLPRLKEKAKAVEERLVGLRDSLKRGERIVGGVRVAFIGLPNAGKSSLFNALLGEDRSIVTDQAGTTRDVVRETLTLVSSAGEPVLIRLEDLAGLRKAEDRVESLGIERALQAGQKADVRVWVVEAETWARDWAELSVWRERLGGRRPQDLYVISQNDRPGTPTGDTGLEWLRTSAVTGEGIRELSRRLADASAEFVRRSEGELVLTLPGQAESVRGAAEALARAQKATGEDLFAADVRSALRELAPLIGETPVDEILGRIFSNFCIGK